MAAKQILISGTVHFAKKELAALSPQYEILELASPSRAAFFKDCQEGGPYSKISAIYTNHGAPLNNFDKELIDALPSSVKYICHHGAGYDPIDVAAATAKGIQISNTPDAVADATATIAMFLILSALRQLWNAQLRCHAGEFKKGTSPAVQNDPEEKVLGIVGMGGIGRALVKRALGFDMKIIYHNRKPVDPSLLAAFPEGSVTYCKTLDELLQKADVVSLHIPLNANTTKFFGKKQFYTMKKGGCLVNTARGGVIDEEALLEALESGQLSSAGLDVFPNEPEINPLLIKNDRLTLLPHMGTETCESRWKMEMMVINNLKSGLSTGLVKNVIPEQEGLFKASS